jgi:hypothetical protein
MICIVLAVGSRCQAERPAVALGSADLSRAAAVGRVDPYIDMNNDAGWLKENGYHIGRFNDQLERVSSRQRVSEARGRRTRILRASRYARRS